MLDISIVIVSWNAKNHLQNCIRSIDQKKGNYSRGVIVVDNGSTDGSIEMVQQDFSDVTLVQNRDNLGFAKANNQGIKISEGRYLALINSDVIVLDDCLEKMLLFMDNHPEIGMLGPHILNADRTLQPSCRRFPSLWNNLVQALGINRLFPKSAFWGDWMMKDWPHDTIRAVDALSGCFWLVRKAAVEQVGLLDEDFFIYGEDVDWCRRFNASGWQVVFYPEAEAIHFGGASSANAPVRFCLEMQKADLQYWKKHHGRFRQILYASIILLRHSLRLPFFGLLCILLPSRRAEFNLKFMKSARCIPLAARCIFLTSKV